MRLNGMSPAKAIRSFIPCQLAPGMFSNEYAVTLHVEGGAVVSLFADKTLVSVNGSQHEGYLKVTVVEDASGQPMVLLPSEVLETGTRWVQMPPGQIQQK